MSEIRSTESIISSAKAALGDEAWSKLQEKTKIGIITSEACFLEFKNKKSFDFSSAIVPLMKGLELELRNAFYEPYLSYIKSNYLPNEYIEVNFGMDYKDRIRNIIDNKSLLLSISKSGRLAFKPISEQFTLGKFRYSIATTPSLRNFRADKSFILYCRNVLFKEKAVETDDIICWIKDLVSRIERLRILRNGSSHAGIIQNSLDAETAINELVKIEKTFAIIVLPPFVNCCE